MRKKRTKTLLEQISISGGCFLAGLLCILYGSLYQGELLGSGSVSIGKNSAYVHLSGKTAQNNINFFWVGAVIFFLGALINLIVTALREFENPQPFENCSNTIMICPRCETPFSLENLEWSECPDCHVDLVKLEGFYDSSRKRD